MGSENDKFLGGQVATARLDANQATPRLAVDACRAAAQRMPSAAAEPKQVLLYLSTHFANMLPEVLRTVSRATGSLQVYGALADGVMTESGWSCDRPAAAVLLLGNDITLRPTPGFQASGQDKAVPLLTHGANNSLPDGVRPRYGFVHPQGLHWNHARVGSARHGECCFDLQGASLRHVFALGIGWRLVGGLLQAEHSAGLTLHSVIHNGRELRSAASVLHELLPAAWQTDCPWEKLVLLRFNPDTVKQTASMTPEEVAFAGDFEPLAVLGEDHDGGLLLSQSLLPGDRMQWGYSDPETSRTTMRQTMAQAARKTRRPLFGLMYSCLGRGPWFYGDEDEDLLAWQSSFPGVPLLGAYGQAPIWPASGGNHILPGAVVSAIFDSHV